MFRAQNHVTLALIKIALNRQTGVYFNAIWPVINRFVVNNVKSVNFVHLDILMGHLHWMHPGDCNDHWGGEPISPIRLKPLNH